MTLHEKEKFAFAEKAFIGDLKPAIAESLPETPNRVASAEPCGEKSHLSAVAGRFQPVGKKPYRRVDIMVARRVDGAPNKDDIGIDDGRILLGLPRFAFSRFGDGRGDFSRIPRSTIEDDIGFHKAIISYRQGECDCLSLRERQILA